MTRKISIILFSICIVLLIMCSCTSTTRTDYVNLSPFQMINDYNFESPGINSIEKFYVYEDSEKEPFTFFIIGLDWHKGIFLLKEEGNREYIEPINVGGFEKHFKVNSAVLSQGKFLEVFSAGHMGTGYMILRSLDDLYNDKYVIEDAIDDYYELVEHLPDYIVLPTYLENREGVLFSRIILNGALTPEYLDINEDGHTDIIMRGCEVWIYDDDGYEKIFKTFFIKKVYLYDEGKDEFILDESLSEYLEVESN